MGLSNWFPNMARYIYAFINICLFLYKVDSLRAGFNLKYVYVLKSLTLFSKKIDCLSLLG